MRVLYWSQRDLIRFILGKDGLFHLLEGTEMLKCLPTCPAGTSLPGCTPAPNPRRCRPSPTLLVPGGHVPRFPLRSPVLAYGALHKTASCASLSPPTTAEAQGVIATSRKVAKDTDSSTVEHMSLLAGAENLCCNETKADDFASQTAAAGRGTSRGRMGVCH